MKTLKYILGALTILFALNLNAQSVDDWIITTGSIVINPTKPDNSTILEVPEQFKSKIPITSISNAKGTKTFTKFIKELKGNVSITFDVNDNIIAILVPNNVKLPKDILTKDYGNKNPSVNCYGHDCVTQPQTEGSAALCGAETIICALQAFGDWLFK